MGDFSGLGKILIVLGIAIVAIGFVFLLGEKIPWLGRLPGDICYRGKNVTFYFPIVTSLLISIILSLILYLFFRK